MICGEYNFRNYYSSEITSYGPHVNCEYANNDFMELEKVNILKETFKPSDGPMDSPWPMYCHDTRHTSRSPYSTASNSGFEKWEFHHPDSLESGITAADDGTIYYGCGELYAVYPNGTLKWFYDVSGWIECCCPAIDENGIIYVGTVSSIEAYFYAIYPNGTLKWKYPTGDIYSSPVIGSDGTIYFGCEDNRILALYPNGTLRWSYTTGDAVLSSPAIGDDGTVYCGSNDYNLYALYPNNGTLKWKFSTGYYIRVSPCIADDGTIYCVSRDGYLYAVYPNGTIEWKTYVHAGTSPTIGGDGTIYAGWTGLYAVDPTDGSVKWTFDVGGTIQGGTPCNSIDGTIYVGTSDGGELIAVKPDGTLKWRKGIGTCESAPAIGEDGTVYIGTMSVNDGYLHAFGPLDPNAPGTPTISGPANGIVGKSYDYTFTTVDPNGDDVFYYIDWGDGTNSGWLGPHGSGDDVKVGHTWSKTGTYVIQAQAKDTNDLKSDWGTLQIKMPRNKIANNMLLLNLLKHFPLL